MKLVLLITLLEATVLMSWLLIRRRNRSVPATVLIAPLVRSVVVAGDDLLTSRAAARWAFISASQLSGQADDRSPMLISVSEAAGSPAARRSRARRSHQLNFKKWSTERHD